MCIHTQADSTALHLACLGGHKEVIKMLVEDFSFPVNVRDKVWQSRMYVHAVQLCVCVHTCSSFGVLVASTLMPASLMCHLSKMPLIHYYMSALVVPLVQRSFGDFDVCIWCKQQINHCVSSSDVTAYCKHKTFRGGYIFFAIFMGKITLQNIVREMSTMLY